MFIIEQFRTRNLETPDGIADRVYSARIQRLDYLTKSSFLAPLRIRAQQISIEVSDYGALSSLRQPIRPHSGGKAKGLH
jgi:hypothetical protein